MRLILSCFLALILTVPPAQAQSIMDNLPSDTPRQVEPEVNPPTTPVSPPASMPAQAPAAPPADPYTVSDVNADVTADSAAHARDQALMQAERAAFVQLCARSGAPDSATKLSDDAIAALVQSFEVQSEHLSAVRYIGVFTIRFKPGAVQRKIGKYAPVDASVVTNAGAGGGGDAKPAPSGPVSHLAIAVQTDSLAAWAQIKRRLMAVPQVSRVDTIDLGRGVSHMDLVYGGSIDDLQNAVTSQGFVLRQSGVGDWELDDGSMVPR